MNDARSASAQLGKIYSFSIPENAVKYRGSGSVMTITPMTSEQIEANKTQSNGPTPQPPNPSSQTQPSNEPSTVTISSTPPGADIFVDIRIEVPPIGYVP
jgi:hypothetical protein